MTVGVPPPPRGGPVLNAKVYNQPWSGWFRSLYNLLNAHSATAASQGAAIQTIQQSLADGITVTVILPPHTTTGLQGEMVFNNGILTGYNAPT